MSTEPPTEADWQASVDDGQALQFWESGVQDMIWIDGEWFVDRVSERVWYYLLFMTLLAQTLYRTGD
jgi:hypothetical protein